MSEKVETVQYNLGSKNSWVYKSGYVMRAKSITIKQITYYDNGKDKNTYKLNCDVIKKIGCEFTESKEPININETHPIMSNSNMIRFTIVGLDGISHPKNGSLTIKFALIM